MYEEGTTKQASSPAVADGLNEQQTGSGASASASTATPTEASGKAGQHTKRADVKEPVDGKPPSKSKAAKLGPLLLLGKQSFKAALAPTIALGILQSSVVANYLGSVGYLMVIATVFAVPMQPRARFLQSLAIDLVLIGLSCAVNLLAMYSAIQARKHTAAPQTSPGLPAYNASQSAVAGLWLFVQVWAVNAARARWPNLNLPTVVYVIVASAALSNVVVMTNTAQATNLVRQLLVAFTAAFGIAFVTSLVVFPLSCRTMALKKVAQLMGALNGVLDAHAGFLKSLTLSSQRLNTSSGGMASPEESADGKEKTVENDQQKSSFVFPESVDGLSSEAKALHSASRAALELFGALATDMELARMELFWGKLLPHDLKILLNLMRDCLIPITGLQSIVDISLQTSDDITAAVAPEEQQQLEQAWCGAITQLRSPLDCLQEIVKDGFSHAGMVLELIPRPKKGQTEEANGCRPGDVEFIRILETRLETLRTQTRQSVRAFSSGRRTQPLDVEDADEDTIQAQVYLLLHMDTLMHATAQAVFALVEFADSKVADGTMARNRLVLPTVMQLRKFLAKIFSREESQADQGEDTVADGPVTGGITYLGDSFIRRRDPDHMPPTTAWQRVGAALSNAWHVFGSRESAHGARAACAVMSVGIINYLESTQHFFLQHRLLWAETIIILGMATSAGANFFGLGLRLAGTALGMVVSLLSWYIPDHRVPGIIVIQFVGMSFMYACVMLYPNLLPGFFVGIVTTVMITGYELQVDVLGPAYAATALQEYLPIYELAPYRLATVAVGCFVAFFWTIFPFPVTERRVIRMEMARGLYLMAEMFGAAQSTAAWRIKKISGGHDPVVDEAMGKLAAIQEDLMRKMTLLLPGLEQHAALQKWEPVLGGRWPADVYKRLIQNTRRIFMRLILASYISYHAPELNGEQHARWKETSLVLLQELKETMQGITTTLATVSNSLHSGRSLPPFVPVPAARPEAIKRVLRLLPRTAAEDSVQHPTYAAFAVREVCVGLICRDLRIVVEDAGKLVGKVDFSMGIQVDVEAGAEGAVRYRDE